MNADDDGDQFAPSRLGTKAHWDSVYESEVRNFEETGDEGEIWFGESSMRKMVDWAREHVPPPASADVGPHPHILEIGSGNGALLFALLSAGYAPVAPTSTPTSTSKSTSTATLLCGIDYSGAAIALARAIAAERGDAAQKIAFLECDFLGEDGRADSDIGRGSWDLVLDKGTYDAIALAGKDDAGVEPVAKYPGRLAELVRPGGHFLITSCNFTEEELKARFITPETDFHFHSRIDHPTFTFGGATGNVVSSVAFVKAR